MTRFAMLFLVVLSACSAGMRQPAHAHPFCEGGFLIKPGDYAGPIQITFRGRPPVVLPLISTDTVCLRRPPAPMPQQAPIFPDDEKPDQHS